MELAMKYMLLYVKTCMQVFGEQWATPKNHWLVHFLEDCKRFGCHFDRLATYKYENEYSDFGRLLRNGYRCDTQLR